ncbi:MAG: Gfo/Idh/MocA family oxidoreductase, partial [bacterium]|nr:Gfo/Idh/MocA family oxidoreductase [bacterium]
MVPPAGFGLIGCGVMGEVHARTIAASGGARFVAACDQDASRAERCAQEHGAEKHFTDWRAVIEDPQVDAVSIVTPDFAHEEIVNAAIAAGKDILVEKPLATPVVACQRVVEALGRQVGMVMVDFAKRWDLPFV